jgi:hypothetical protein
MKASPVILLIVPVLLVSSWMLLEAQTAGQSKAVVVGVTGEWSVPTSTPNSGKYVHFLETIALNQNSCAFGTGGSLVLQFEDNNAFSYPCDKPYDSPCQVPRPTQPSTKGDKPFVCARRIFPLPKMGVTDRIWAAVLPLIHDSVDRFVTPVSRGLESELQDAVVSRNADRIDFTPAFKGMDSGTYTIRLEPLTTTAKPPTTATASSSPTAKVQWSEGAAAIATINGVSDGLYRLERLQPSGEIAGTAAWVLVADANYFSKTSAAFQAAAAATKQWPRDADARAPRSVLRAYLEALSKTAPSER